MGMYQRYVGGTVLYSLSCTRHTLTPQCRQDLVCSLMFSSITTMFLPSGAVPAVSSPWDSVPLMGETVSCP